MNNGARMENRQKFEYMRRQKSSLIAIQWILMILAFLIVVVWKHCIVDNKLLPIDGVWYFTIDILFIVLLVLGLYKAFVHIWSKKEQGECMKIGQSIRLILGENSSEINLDDIKEVGLYDNRENTKWLLFELSFIYNWVPLRTLDSAYGTICLEIKTETKSYKFIDRPIGKNDEPITSNGLYKTMKLIKLTYNMKEKQDNRGMPMLDVYVSRK